MHHPHRVEHDDAERAPLDRDVQRLVMRIGKYPDALRPILLLSRLLEQPLGRSGAMPDQRRIFDEFQRILPVRGALAELGRNLLLLVELIVAREGL